MSNEPEDKKVVKLEVVKKGSKEQVSPEVAEFLRWKEAIKEFDEMHSMLAAWEDIDDYDQDALFELFQHGMHTTQFFDFIAGHYIPEWLDQLEFEWDVWQEGESS